ncbi:MAG TPA: TrkH family potassium uptake protein [Bacteroidales bacterium]|nr:TrkH family potassium uptake protein [Bacteroidales bacterium]
MINFRIIARIFSLLLIFEGLFMLLSAGVSYLYGESFRPFIYSALITVVTGIIVFTPLRNEEKVTGKKEGYIIVTGIWVLFSLFATLPYLFSGALRNFPDAFFESLSGFTTTSATIFTDVEKLGHGVLFWRSLTQWLGGIAVIFISLYVLPIFKSIYIQMPSSDFSGQAADKIHPRIRDTAKRLIFIYLIITLSEIILLVAAGMPVFDSVCHSFSTLSTGGFSTMNAGPEAFSGPFIKVIITVFMFIAGVNMAFYYFGLKLNFRKIFSNSEFFFYTIISLTFILIVTLVLTLHNNSDAWKAFMDGAFMVISIISTTGYYLGNNIAWNDLIIIILFILMFTGGTAGSTSGGIKMVRLLLVTKNAGKELKRLIHPNAYIPVKIDKKIVSQTTIFNLLVFITLYFLTVCISSLLISLMGSGIVESFSTAASLLGNIGPHITEAGLSSDYSAVPVAGKWFLSALMIAGRLELLTVLMLFTRSFYRD